MVVVVVCVCARDGTDNLFVGGGTVGCRMEHLSFSQFGAAYQIA